MFSRRIERFFFGISRYLVGLFLNFPLWNLSWYERVGFCKDTMKCRIVQAKNS